MQTDQTITLNNNQASCMVERATMEGREFTNVCTGRTTVLPYTPIEIGGGILMLAFLVFFIFNWMSISRRMRR